MFFELLLYQKYLFDDTIPESQSEGFIFDEFSGVLSLNPGPEQTWMRGYQANKDLGQGPFKLS